ncbi:MAG: hypothetical protein LBL47_01750 [Lactobacillus sp.]|jgi:hypothetical protein|nr:hypothetical protein [Lactobacillus sp.]
MKKLILFAVLFTIFGCNSKGEVNVVEVGKIPPEREALYEKRNYEICETNPERCYQGVPW